jgi:transcriptional regulator GlxA family with amidase domain
MYPKKILSAPRHVFRSKTSGRRSLTVKVNRRLLRRNPSRLDVRGIAPAGISHKGVAKSLRFLSRYWHKPIGVDDLVKAASMSRRGFQKAFARHTGRSPGRELRRVRLQGARQLLVESDYKPQVVAEMCGFRKVNSFWVAFKQATGLPPRRFRKRSGT